MHLVPPEPPTEVSTRSPRRRSTAAQAGALVLVLLASGSLAGCSGEPGTEPDEPSGSSAAAPAPVPRLELVTRVTRVAGELGPVQQRRLSREASRLVRGYVEAAFLGDYPRGDFGALPGFTRGARAEARRDRAVLTGQRFGDAERVAPRSASAYFSVVTARRRPVGATARFSLDLDVTTDGTTRAVHVGGRLLLTPTRGGWRIFGYDLAQDGRNADGSAS